MVSRNYSIDIQAGADKVWFALWDLNAYRIWTRVFSEGTYVVTDNWKKGSKVHFLNPDGNGIFSHIDENVPNEKMFFTHLGHIKNFQEQPLNEATVSWSDAKENYTLQENGGITSLQVFIQSEDAYVSFFDASFPKALEMVKSMAENFFITIESEINMDLQQVWKAWNSPEDIVHWNAASDDWHTVRAFNDLKEEGTYTYRMEAKDGSMGFDLEGKYTKVEPYHTIDSVMCDGRIVKVQFSSIHAKTIIRQSFEPETIHSIELQRDGWKAILDNFKKYCDQKNH